MVPNHALLLDFGEGFRRAFAIDLASRQNVVNRFHQAVRDGDQRTLVPDLGFQTVVARLEGAPLLARCRPGGFDQRRPEPRIAVRRMPTFVFSGALVITGADLK
jgi:hypothetical protein